MFHVVINKFWKWHLDCAVVNGIILVM